MTFWQRYWARIKAVICITIAFGIFLFPVPYAHAEMMKTSANYDLSIAMPDHEHHGHLVDSDMIIVDKSGDAADTHHDNQCCPAGCMSVALTDLFTSVSPKKTSVQAGLAPHVPNSADISGFLRPPLA